MNDARRHILATFDEALGGLRNEVLMMASLTESNFIAAMTGLFNRDDDLCNNVIADDEDIDQLEKQVDKNGIEILLRYQPVASDLRQVISAMKLSNNLERIADQAVSVARKARKLNDHPALPEVALIDPLYRHSLGMYRDGIDAYVNGNVELAMTLKSRDRELDEMNRGASQHLTECMVKNPAQIEGYLNLIFIARHLERVGDHTTNIAEDAVYATAAEDIRHTQPAPPQPT